MLQIISEVYDLLRRGASFSNEELHTTFAEWNEGRLKSYLIEITAVVFKTLDSEDGGYLVDKILDQAGSKGTGKWTSQEAMELPVSIPTIDMAVAMRELSVYKELRVAASKLYQPTINKIKEGHQQLLSQLEGTLFFSFLIAYAQGLSMLAKASAELDMQIPLPDVVNVWKSGCIIRSTMLVNFSSVFKRNNHQPNILLDDEIATLIKPTYQSVKNVIALAMQAGIPVPSIMSALSYFEAFCTDRLPVNLIQAQRDYFGAHTYQRIDKPGVFHTEWHVNQ
ncbi:MAG: phosphogluconate dehydrogenase (NADP(+)-dependent, decarboxylating), partial [Chitinophagaceae bacterium]